MHSAAPAAAARPPHHSPTAHLMGHADLCTVEGAHNTALRRRKPQEACMQHARAQWPGGHPAHLDHEVLDAAVEGGAVVVALCREPQEVLARAGRDVAVQLQVEVAHVGVHAHVPLLRMCMCVCVSCTCVYARVWLAVVVRVHLDSRLE